MVGTRALSFLQTLSEQSPSQVALSSISLLLLLLYLLVIRSGCTDFPHCFALAPPSVACCCHPHVVIVQANVQVVPARESYPTVASMVNDMEMRRDLIENLVKIWTPLVLLRMCVVLACARFRRGGACLKNAWTLLWPLICCLLA